MAHAHHVDARDALANVAVDTLEVTKDGFFPVQPILVEEKLAVLFGGAFGESPVKRPHGPIDVSAQALMRGVHIAERRRIEKDGIPGGLGAARIRIAVEREIGGEPRGINEIMKFRKLFEEVGGEKGGGGKENEFRLKLRVAGENAPAATRGLDAVHHLAGSNVLSHALEKTPGDPAVAFGPGK